MSEATTMLLMVIGFFVCIGFVVWLDSRKKSRGIVIRVPSSPIWKWTETTETYTADEGALEHLCRAKLALVNAQRYTDAAEVRELIKRLFEKTEPPVDNTDE